MAKQNLTAERLRELLHYDPDTGVFTRRVRTSNRVNVGDLAGGSNGGRYRKIGVLGTLHYEHRLAWLYMTGEWPKQDIDHINGIGGDNRFCNLRDVSRTVNMQNLKRPCISNGHGHFGVTASGKKSKPWQARIRIDGASKFIGNFQTPQEASAAYMQAKRLFHVGNTI